MKQINFNSHAHLNELLTWQNKAGYDLSVQQKNEFVGLSKKTINKVCQTLQQFNLNSPSLISELEKIQILTSSALKVNEALPKLFHEVFNKNNGITELSSDSIVNAVNMLARIITQGNLEEVVITIGMGASDAMPSLRLPSYILPAIKVLKGISESGLNIGLPTVRVFKATYAGVYANGMDLKKVKYVTETTLKFLSDFVSNFYPELYGSFVFESDVDYKETPSYSTITTTAKKIKILPGLEKELNALKLMGEKHGGKNGMGNAVFYAAAHPIYNQAIISTNEINAVTKFVLENPDPKLIIDFGGRPQKTFNSIIEVLRSTLDTNDFLFPALINVIIKTGKIPVYYKAKHGDILLTDTCNSFDDFAIDQMTQVDYDFLFEEIADYEYLAFVNRFKLKNKI